MKKIILVCLLMLTACGGPETKEESVPELTPTTNTSGGYSSKEFMGSPSKFPIWFNLFGTDCLNADCGNPDQQVQQNSDPVDDSRNIGSSPPADGPQSNDITPDGPPGVESVNAFREDYHPIDVKIDWEHE